MDVFGRSTAFSAMAAGSAVLGVSASLASSSRSDFVFFVQNADDCLECGVDILALEADGWNAVQSLQAPLRTANRFNLSELTRCNLMTAKPRCPKEVSCIPNQLNFSSCPATLLTNIGTIVVNDNRGSVRQLSTSEGSTVSAGGLHVLPDGGMLAGVEVKASVMDRAATVDPVAAGGLLSSPVQLVIVVVLAAGIAVAVMVYKKASQKPAKRPEKVQLPSIGSLLHDSQAVHNPTNGQRFGGLMDSDVRAHVPAAPAHHVTVQAPTTVNANVVVNLSLPVGIVNMAGAAQAAQATADMGKVQVEPSPKAEKTQDVEASQPSSPVDNSLALVPAIIAAKLGSDALPEDEDEAIMDKPARVDSDVDREKQAAAAALQAIRSVNPTPAAPAPARVRALSSSSGSSSDSVAHGRDEDEDGGFSLFPSAIKALAVPTLPSMRVADATSSVPVPQGGESSSWSLAHGVDLHGRPEAGAWTVTNTVLWKHTKATVHAKAGDDSEDEAVDHDAGAHDTDGAGRLWHANWAPIVASKKKRRGGVISHSALVRKRRAAILKRIREEPQAVKEAWEAALRRQEAKRAEAEAQPQAGQLDGKPSVTSIAKATVLPNPNPPIVVPGPAVPDGRGQSHVTSEIVLQRELGEAQAKPVVEGVTSTSASPAQALPAKVVIGCSGVKRALSPALEVVAVATATDIPSIAPGVPVTAVATAGKPEATISTQLPAQAEPTSTQEDGTTPGVGKYLTMLRVGVPLPAVLAKMRADGCGPQEIEDMAAQAQAGSVGATLSMTGPAKPAPPAVAKPEAPGSPTRPEVSNLPAVDVPVPDLPQHQDVATEAQLNAATPAVDVAKAEETPAQVTAAVPTTSRPMQGPPRPAGVPAPPAPGARAGPARPPGAPAPPAPSGQTGGPPRPPGAPAVGVNPSAPVAVAPAAPSTPTRPGPGPGPVMKAPGSGPQAAPTAAPAMHPAVAAQLALLFGKSQGSTAPSSSPMAGSPIKAARTPVSSINGAAGGGAAIPGLARVSLVDGRRAQNVGIALAKLRAIPAPVLCQALMELCPSVVVEGKATTLALVQAQVLADVCPTAEDVKAVQAWAKGQDDPAAAAKTCLPEAERFFLSVLEVPSSPERARALVLRLSFQTRVQDLHARIGLITAATEEVKGKAGHLKALLGATQTALAQLGGSAWSGVTGGSKQPLTLLNLPNVKTARLPSLPARDPRGTMAHYVAAVMDMSQAQVLDELLGKPVGVDAASGSAAGGPSWKAKTSKGPSMPSPASLWPACASLAGAREDVAGILAEVTSLEQEVAKMARMAGLAVPLPVVAGEGVEEVDPCSPVAQAAGRMAGVLARLRTAYTDATSTAKACVTIIHEAIGAVPSSAAPGPAMEAVAAALLDTVGTMGKARMDMRVHQAANTSQ